MQTLMQFNAHVVLVAPSAKGLQRLLDTCTCFAASHDIVFNTCKSQVLVVPGRNSVVLVSCLSNTALLLSSLLFANSSSRYYARCDHVIMISLRLLLAVIVSGALLY